MTKHRGDVELDRLGRALLERAAATSEEINQAAALPFLYARIQARTIDVRSTRSALLSIARSVLLILALVTATVAGLFWLQLRETVARPAFESVLLGGVRSLSSDEVLEAFLGGRRAVLPKQELKK
jgi:hypothetical protein